MRTRLSLVVAALATMVWSTSAFQVAAPPTPQTAVTLDRPKAVDKAFSAWTRATPGCAVGVGENGRPVLERAYGMADLEHDAANGAGTIFEAGSVSKQFTAAAVLLLVKDGRIGLDDPVQKFVPELRDYGAPLTIRHLLTHTSGLRDWGSLVGIAGMPRGARAYTHAHVVDMLSRQTALNFTPGTAWSYSNSGYNLAAVIVSRISGMSFAEFSRTRLFEPLGLSHTSWRDEYARVVPGRAIAYATAGNRYRQDMPFENVHGNGGLLTTVGDLLKWNEAFAAGPMSGAVLADQQWTLARLNDGRALHYGFGVFRGEYKGVPEVFHSGATAGYRAFLTYYPSARLSVAVLCNAGNANATQLTRVVSDIYLGDRLRPDAPRTPVLREAQGPTVGLQRDETYRPALNELVEFGGVYESAEVETVLRVDVVNDALVIRRRPDATIALRPHSKDRFEAGAGLGLITFRRTNGQIDGFTVTQDRVWDLRFARRPGGGVIGTTGFIVAGAAQRSPLSDADIVDIATIVKLEDLRRFDAEVLARLLTSAHPEVKRRAVVALGRIPNPGGTALLEPLRKDPSTEIVATVAFAHGQIKDPAAVPWLAETLRAATTPAPVALEAARALGKVRTPEAWTALAAYLTSAQDTPATAPVVGEALLSMGRFVDRLDVVPVVRMDIAPIVRWTTTANAEVRWRATWALFRPRNPAAVPHLLKLSQDPSPDVRFWAVRGLAPALVDEAKAEGIDRGVASARLRAAVEDPDRRVRTEALRALGAYDDDASFEVVLAALDDPDTWMSVSAAESLGRFKDRIAALAPRLGAAAAPGKPVALRLTALTPLVQLAPPLALEAASALLREPSLFVRTSATQALRRMGPIGQQRLDQLAADPTMKDLLVPAPAPGGGRGAGAAPPAPGSGRTDADYRAIVERWIVPAYNGSRAPRAIWTTPRGEIELELSPGESPLGMEELVRLTESGAIAGTVFSRVVPNFVAQQATIAGANRLRDEVSRLGLTRGTLAWASSGLDTGRPGYTLGSTPQPHNEGDFTALGRVIRGMDVVDRLELGDAVTAARMVR